MCITVPIKSVTDGSHAHPSTMMLTALRCPPLRQLVRRAAGRALVNISAVRSAASPAFALSQCRHRGLHSSAPSAAAAAQGKFSDAETSSAGPGSLPLAAFYSLCDLALNSIQNRLEMPDLDIPTFESELTVRHACAIPPSFPMKGADRGGIYVKFSLNLSHVSSLNCKNTWFGMLQSGALSVKVEGVGNWVLNRQTPNRQIWLASSLSGPKRYDFDPKSQQWVYARDQSKLKDLLESELSAATKLSIRFDEHF